MSFHNNRFVGDKAKYSSTPDEGERNFKEVTETTAVQASPGVSGNFIVSAKSFDSKNSFSNISSQEGSVLQPPENVTNTSMEFMYENDSEEEFNPSFWLSCKHQGGSLIGDQERVSDAMDITPEYHVQLQIPTVVSDNRKSLETQHNYDIEDISMECTPTPSLCNLQEEFPCSCVSFGNDAITGITKMEVTESTQSLKSNHELNAGIRNHILDLPDLVLEHILSYVDLNELSQKVRPVCRTFYTLCSRILRLAFKSIRTQLNHTLQKLENQHPNNWNPICAEVLTCKLLQSEMDTLRAACSRQIESGHFCFIHGDVLHEYHSILKTVQDGKINMMLDGFSETLIKLNEKPLNYWDNRYDDEDMPLGDLKLLGVEIIEVFLSALNASGCIVVTYQPSLYSASSSDDKQGEDASGSCMMAGCVSINHSTELKPPATENICLKGQRTAILRYIRSLVRANNCDIVLYKLRAYTKVKEAPLPIFEHRAWTLCNSKVMHNNLVQESYKREPVADHVSTPVPDCNMHVICSFEMVCPIRVNPFGIALNRWHQSPLPSEVLISEQKDKQGTNLAESLSGDHYIFKMDFKTTAFENGPEYSIEVEDYVTKNNKWYLNINSNSSSAD